MFSHQRSVVAAAMAVLLAEGKGPKINYKEIRGEGKPIKGAKRVGRNEPCPCGSGKKFKKCHLVNPTDVYAVCADIGKSVVAGATRERAGLNVFGATTHRTACGDEPDDRASHTGPDLP